MVVSKVTRLDELRQADLTPQLGSKNKLNDKILSDVAGFTGVDKVLPVISVVGSVIYNDSKSDVPVYAVTSGYLTDSAIKPLYGKIFESNTLVSQNINEKEVPEVAGAQIDFVENKPDEVQFNIIPEEWVNVRQGSNAAAQLLGLTKRADSALFGTKTEGGDYITKEGTSREWIKSNYVIYEKDENGRYQEKESVEGFVATTNLVIEATIYHDSKVLGVSSIDTDLLGTASETDFTIVESDDPNFVVIPEEMVETGDNKTKAVALSAEAVKQTVINTAAVELFGLAAEDAVGKKVNIAFTATSSVLGTDSQKIETIPELYEIVAVIPDDKSPVMYVPFIDLKTAGIENYSQARLYAEKKDQLATIRKQAEALGFNTRSAVDTVARINSLFGTLRIILGIMGTVALIVASLGMFNTFTVSLLERTREVGLMKAMGMRSNEVQRLFLTEAMIMGFSGGTLGIFVGFLLGKLLDSVLTVLSVTKGQGALGITYIPLNFIVLIGVLSLLVGILTGIYPSTRAKKISALNALRYE
jgi:ABC-type antimicrobial peptide transport system permease subunit